MGEIFSFCKSRLWAAFVFLLRAVYHGAPAEGKGIIKLKLSAEQVARLLTEEMEGVMQLSVPLVAEAHWGKNWLEAKG